MGECKRRTHVQELDVLISGFETLLSSCLVTDASAIGSQHERASLQQLLASAEEPQSLSKRFSYAETQKIIEAFEASKRLRMEGSTTATNEPDSVDTWLSSHHLPPGHPTTSSKDAPALKCPFASMSKAKEALPRPQAMPTPPETNNHVFDDDDVPEHSAFHPQRPRATSSMQGSISKCPIRMLDDRPPEEVAKYFEEHKHEIPRSHAICVKRYQSNEESIRRLDAKYGNLVNMIKGLGSKHQSLMPPTGDSEDGDSTHSYKGVSEWARNLTPEAREALPDDEDRRESHFERPLDDVRVGESPTRPWGIHVPRDAGQEDPVGQESRQQQSKRQSEDQDHHDGVLQVPLSSSQSAKPTAKRKLDLSPAPVIFNGPVFIGYPPDQAIAFLRELGASTGQNVT